MPRLQGITLCAPRDIPFNKLGLCQANVRRVKASISIKDLAEDIARGTLFADPTFRPVPDEIPVIGPAPSLPGLVIATGLSGHGFGLGPGVGKLAAQLATGRPTLVDPAPFRYDRFTGAA